MKKLLLLLFPSMLASANISAQSDDPIQFADQEVKRICVENWDFNKDGELSYKEAAGPMSVGMVFAKNSNITSFNEFQYFTNVKLTEEFAFEACVSLEEITFPSSMESLEKGSFCDCSSLAIIKMNEGLKYIGEGCFANCSAIENIDIPESVAKFGNSAFHKCTSLVSVKIPALVEYLPVELFNSCMSLETVVLQEGLKGMGNSVFNECYSLKSVSLPSTFKSFGMWVFWDCSSVEKYEVAESNPNFCSVNGVLYTKDKKTLVQYPAGSTAKEFVIPEGTEILGFASCEGSLNLEKITTPSTMKLLDGASVYKCENLKTIALNDGLEEIGNEVFYGCMYLEDPLFPQSIKKIGSGAFTGCESFKHVVLPEQVTYIDFRLFFNCYSLETVDFSKKLDVIDQEAFSGCGMLQSIVIPKTVSYIGPIAFSKCTNMNEIKLYNENAFIAGAEISQILPTDDNGVLLENERILYVPKGCKSVYEESDFWSHAKEIREFDDTAVDAVESDVRILNINGMEVSVPSEDGVFSIYTLSGQLFDSIDNTEESIEIPAGIYVINGRKIVVR